MREENDGRGRAEVAPRALTSLPRCSLAVFGVPWELGVACADAYRRRGERARANNRDLHVAVGVVAVVAASGAHVSGMRAASFVQGKEVGALVADAGIRP